MLLSDPETIRGLEDCQYALRVLETEAYGAIVNAFRAQGPFSQYYRLILEHLRIILNVSVDRHKAEIRRALADPILLKVATGLNPQTDVTFEWAEEAKRSCGNASFPSALAMESPAFYRFNFLRTSKNDLLLELADHLAMLAVEHNRSKTVENGEEKMFQALKKPKATATIPVREQQPEHTPFLKPAEKPKAAILEKPKPAIEKTTAVNTIRQKAQVTSTKKKPIQKEMTASIASILAAIPASGVGLPRKQSVGRPRKQQLETPMPKPRFGQIIAARSAVVRGHGATGSKRGRGAKNFTTTTTKAPLSTHSSPQRMVFGPAGQQPGFLHQQPGLHTIMPQKTPPRAPSHHPPSLLSPPKPPVVNNQPGIGQRTSVKRQGRKGAVFGSGPVSSWPSSSETKPWGYGGRQGGRVPVSPLSVMLPVGTSASAKIPVGPSRYFGGPGSPARPFLSGEAPGVYADDYNANAVDSADTGSGVPDGGQMRPHQFFSSLSATYFAQTAPPPAKQRRFSPGPPTLMPPIGHGPRMTGITTKNIEGNGDGNCAEMEMAGSSADAAILAARSASGGSLAMGSVTLPARQSSGQKLIVLPSGVLRRTHPQTTGPPGATQKAVDLQKGQPGAKQQSVIIFRRAPSATAASTVASTCTTPTPSTTPAPSTPITSTPSESQEDAPK